MSPKEREVFEAARYKLITLDNLLVTDVPTPNATWKTNTKKCLALIDEVLSESSKNQSDL